MLGQKIKNKRKELNLTQEYLAEKLNISRQAVSKWEAGKSEPSMNNLLELSKIFGVDISYFNEEKKESKREKIFWSILVGFLGIVFYFIYYYGIMEGFFQKDPTQMPYAILTTYLGISVLTFPQAYDEINDKKFENMSPLVAQKFIIPLIYLMAPLIVIYSFFKKDK